jgi:hypothetical protein
MKAELVFNLDEVPISEWDDRKHQGDRPEDDRRSDDLSSRMMNYERHIDNYRYHSWWRVPVAFHYIIAGLRARLPDADESRHSAGYWFCFAITTDTVRQRQAFLRAYQ